MCKGGDKEGGGGGEAGQGAQQPIRNLQVKAEECQMRVWNGRCCHLRKGRRRREEMEERREDKVESLV